MVNRNQIKLKIEAMHKILLTAAMMANIAFAQVLMPNDLLPEGWVTPLLKEKVDAGDYLSVYPTTGIVSYSSEGNAIKMTSTATAGMFVSLAMQIYDATGVSASTGEVDMTDKPMVYLKMKGDIGDKITVNIKGSDWKAVADYNDAPISNEIACSEFRWGKFDYSAYVTEVDDIIAVEVIYNNGVSKAGSVVIDSVIVGTTGIALEFPVDVATLKWSADLSNDYFKSGASENTIAVEGGELTATIGAASEVGQGFEFGVNDGSNNTSLDISDNPLVLVSMKGNAGDTVRVNLKDSEFNFIDGFSLNQIITAQYAEYTFDFSAIQADLSDIAIIEFVVNPGIQEATSLVVNKLELGKLDADGCTLPSDPATGLFKSASSTTNIAMFPNPAVSGNVNFSEELSDVTVYDAVGNVKLNVSEVNSINVSSFETGMYIIHSNEGVFKLIVK